MNIVLFDLSWMAFNLCLALIAVFFAWTFYKATNLVWKTLAGFFWLLFIPNTIYMLTDIMHLFERVHRVPSGYQLIYVLLYMVLMILAIVTFFLGMYPIEQLLLGGKPRKHAHLASTFVIAINFIIGFGIVLGRIERTNSWEVITNLPKVISDATQIFTSVPQIVLVLAFGILCNIAYFGTKYMLLKKKFVTKKLITAIN